jgi:hypothetical protein
MKMTKDNIKRVENSLLSCYLEKLDFKAKKKGQNAKPHCFEHENKLLQVERMKVTGLLDIILETRTM